jgi:glycosyltransferase involved in cell wall biosynthesis
MATDGRLRVMVCLPDLDRTGPVRVLLNVVRHLDRDRFEPSVATSGPDGSLADLVPADVAVVPVGEPGSKHPVAAMTSVLRRARPDVALATLRMNLTVLAARPIGSRRTAVVVRQANHPSANLEELRGDSRWKAGALELVYRSLFVTADRIVAPSDEIARDMTANFLGRASERVSVIPNPVEVDAVAAAARHRPEGAPSGSPTLVTAGRLSPQKGIDLLLDAFAALLPSHPRAVLWVLGDGPERPSLQRRCRRLGIDRSVHLLGFAEDPYPYLGAADIYVSAARYEGLSNSLLEAMACGTPVVATGGPASGHEAVTEGATGWLAEAGSVTSLRAALERAVEGSSSVDRTRVRDECRRRFGVESVGGEYEAVLAGAVGRRHRARSSA